MRALVTTLSLATLLTSTAPASAQPEQHNLLGYDCGFSGRECYTSATHILVVSPQGSVIEVWKGDARLGEVIPIHTLANLTITQSKREAGVGNVGWRVGWGQTSPLSFSAWSSTGCERLILFLIKSDAPDPTQGLLEGWRPASKSGFGYSIATVTPFDYVYVQPPPWVMNMPPSGFCGTSESFKESVFKALNRPLPVDAKK